MIKKILTFGGALSLTTSANIMAKEYSLDEFLNDVRKNNYNYKAASGNLDGLGLRKYEYKLIFEPSVFMQAQTLEDKRPTTNRNAQGDQTDNDSISAGFIQQFNFGLKSKLSYTYSYTEIHNALPSFLPMPKFHDSQLAFELSQSLWRNWNGQESKAQSTLLKSDLTAKEHLENYKLKNILANAEVVYWSMAQMKNMLSVQKDSFDRALKIKSWSQNRVKTGLGDQSDLLQSDANVKFREYELKNTEQKYQETARAFNSFLERNENEIGFTLPNIESKYVQSLKLPIRGPVRDDVKAAIEYEKVTKANLNLSIERNKPNFELYGSYALNGRDIDASGSISNNFKTDHSTTVIGIRFSSPINFINLKNNINGYRQEKLASELTTKQKLFEQDKDWSDLEIKFENAIKNYELALAIEEAQKIKATNESDRLKKGRTTTFQVLNFEQDLANASLLRLKYELEILTLHAQSKIFLDGGIK